MKQLEPTTAIADPDFVISRVLNAPRALAFKAWTDPQHMARWWGPHAMTTPVCELDVRPGGAHRIVMRGADGSEYPVFGKFVEVVEPERLVLTMDCSGHPDAWHDLVKPNRSKEERNPAGVLHTTVTFEDLGDKTRLTVRTKFESPEIRDAMIKMGMNEGWSQSLERLADLLAGKGSDPEVWITRVFDAPRELVFRAWTDPDQLPRWYAPHGCQVRFERIDLRPGGEFLSCILTPDGHECWCTGVYREIEKPERIVYTLAIADRHGNRLDAVQAGMDPEWPAETVLTVTFTDENGKTRLTLHQTVSESLAKRTGAHPSWLQMLDRLATELAGGQSSSAPASS